MNGPVESSAERWLPVVGSETRYAVSDQGRVMRTTGGPGARAGKILKPQLVDGGYVQVFLGAGPGRKPRPHRVHKLVAAAWIGPRPPGHQINHLDGCKTSNAARNLEYLIPRENSRHAARNGLCGYAKLTPTAVLEIRHLVGDVPRQVIADRLGVSLSAVSNVISRQTWSHV